MPFVVVVVVVVTVDGAHFTNVVKCDAFIFVAKSYKVVCIWNQSDSERTNENHLTGEVSVFSFKRFSFSFDVVAHTRLTHRVVCKCNEDFLASLFRAFIIFHKPKCIYAILVNGFMTCHHTYHLRWYVR